MGYLKSVGTSVIYIGLFLAAITFIPGLPPYVQFTEFSITPPKELKGEFASNEQLNNAEILYKEEFRGPENFDSYNGELYTGLHGGYIVKFKNNEIVPIVRLGKDCSGVWQEHICGKILGFKFDKNGVLYVVDTYYGIFKVEEPGKYKLLINTSEPINGKVPRLPNSIDVATNGDLYWTDSSTDFSLYDGVYTVFADPAGRLIRYNAATKKNEVLLENLGFANGVKLSEDESFLLVAETQVSRVLKYYLKGPKAGQHEIFMEGIPGVPDNIHSDGRGGFLISLFLYADSQNPQFFQVLFPHPYIRKMFARLLAVMEAPFKLLNDIYPNHYAERIIHSIGSFEPLGILAPPKILVLRVDATGKIVDAAYGTDGKLNGVSSAYILNDYLWLGTPHGKYLARVPLRRALPNYDRREKRSTSVNENQKAKATVTEEQNTKSTVKKSTTSNQQNVKVDAKVKPNKQDDKTVKPNAQAATPKPVKVEVPKSESQKPQQTTSGTTTPKPNIAKPTAAPVRSNTPTTKEAPAQTKKSDSTTTTPKPVVSNKNPDVKVNTKSDQHSANSETKKTNQKSEPMKKDSVPKSATASSEKSKQPTKQKTGDNNY